MKKLHGLMLADALLAGGGCDSSAAGLKPCGYRQQT